MYHCTAVHHIQAMLGTQSSERDQQICCDRDGHCGSLVPAKDRAHGHYLRVELKKTSRHKSHFVSFDLNSQPRVEVKGRYHRIFRDTPRSCSRQWNSGNLINRCLRHRPPVQQLA